MKRLLQSAATTCLVVALSVNVILALNQESGVESQTADSEWYMAGANPERTSWVSEEVRGWLKVEWYKPIKPYISHKVQVIAANGLLYISTARGLYAIDADNGDEVWVYPTELPLGHSPTVVNGVAYVGGFDRRIHAIDAATGQGLWTYEAGKGFQTNPLVIDDKVFAGNRDGYMYAIHSEDSTTGTPGTLAWEYQTDGPVLYSAAYKDGIIYFASNDSHAYALYAEDQNADGVGDLVWKSAKLPGAGFHSWWPVIYDDPNTGQGFVVFSGSLNHRDIEPYRPDHPDLDRVDIYENPDGTYPEDGTPVGPVTTEPDGSTTINANKITEYFEEPTPDEQATDPAGLNRKVHKPWRRTVFYLDRATGKEHTFDSDGDGQPEYAPILYQGTHSGNRFPPIVGGDGVIYQANNYYSNRWIPRGKIAGWEVGTANLIKVPRGHYAVDEPLAYAGGGNLIYLRHCGDRTSASFDVTIPGSSWTYWDMGGSLLRNQIPGYNFLMFGQDAGWVPVYGNQNGIHGVNGEQNPPMPYEGRIYAIASNVILALSENGTGGDVGLPLAELVSAPESNPPDITNNDLKRVLEAEVDKILTAGHLQPGFVSTGLAENFLEWAPYGGDHLLDYWKAPADIIYHLIRALPHLSPNLQQQVKDYLQTEFTSYPPYEYVHIGWADGTQREVFDRPPEVEIERPDWPARTSRFHTNFTGWNYPPHQFYAMWKYAQVMDDPALTAQIFNDSKHRLETPPADDYLIEKPYVHNAYIAGHLGYIELGKLAGLSDTDPDIQAKQSELDRLLDLRVTTFSKDSPYQDNYNYGRELSITRNFMFLVPELAEHLRTNLLPQIQEAVEEYDNVAPYWFVSEYEASYSEGIISPLYNYHAIFQAKAQILQEPREELLKYLDIPGVKIGDLFYIDNLVAAIEARSDLKKTATPSFGDQDNIITYTLGFYSNGSPLTLTDTLPFGVSAPGNFELEGTSIPPTYDSGQHRLTWSDTPSASQKVTIRYTVTITTSDRLALVNVAELREADGEPVTAAATIIANPYLSYLPLIFKDG
jgi:hypothetical protein